MSDFKPTRRFTADEGDWSKDLAGPDALEFDIDQINRMFDPNATHPNGAKGGIGKSNLNFDFGDEDFAKEIGNKEIDGLGGENNVSDQLTAIVEKIEAETERVNGELEKKQDVLTFDDSPTVNSDNPVKSDGIYRKFDDHKTRMDSLKEMDDLLSMDITSLRQTKQDNLTFDDYPTEGSSNPVKSGGVESWFATAHASIDAVNDAIGLLGESVEGETARIDQTIADETARIDGSINEINENKQDALTFDSQPTENSENPVTSAGVYATAENLQGQIDQIESDIESLDQRKMNVIGFDQYPTEGSENLLTSGVIYETLQDFTPGTGEGGTSGINAARAEAAAEDAETARDEAVSAKNSAVSAKNSAESARDEAISVKNSVESTINDALSIKSETEAVVSKLNTEKLDKPVGTPNVGDFFRIKSVSADGSYEIEFVEEPRNGVQNATISGVSIVSDDGTAEIPLATESGYGLTKSGRSAYGIADGGSWIGSQTYAGIPVIAKANSAEIDARMQSYKPIVPSTIDYAVKAALADGKAPAYTEAEKTAVRERLGIANEWVLLGTLTKSNAVDGVTTNLSGYKQLFIEGEGSASSSAGPGLRFYVNGTSYTMIQPIISSNKKAFVILYDEVATALVPIVAKYTTTTGGALTNDYALNTTTGVSGLKGTKLSGITKITLTSTSDFSSCTIKIYAR